MTKREPSQEHMQVNPLSTPEWNGAHVYCDYCDADATWLHWAVSYKGGVDRNCFACNEHVKWLNKNAVEWMDA